MFILLLGVELNAQDCDPPNATTERDLGLPDCGIDSVGVIQSGDVWQYNLTLGRSYNFKVCYDQTGDISPQIYLWNILGSNPYLDKDETSDANGCVEITYTPCDPSERIVYLSAYSHTCIRNWEDWDITISTTCCTMTCPADVHAQTNDTFNDDCVATSTLVTPPTFSSATICDIMTVDYNITGPRLSNLGNTITNDVYDNPVGGGNTQGSILSNGGSGTLGTPSEGLIIDGNLSPGFYDVTWTAMDCGGTTLTCSHQIIIEPVLACNNNINVTLPASCWLEITPDMLLEGQCAADSEYELSAIAAPIIGNTASVMSGSGAVLMSAGVYQVTATYQPSTPNAFSGASCWGTVTVEDKVGPICTSNFDSKYVLCSADIDSYFDRPTFLECGTVDTMFLDTDPQDCGLGIVGDEDGDSDAVDMAAGDVPAPDASLFIMMNGLYQGVVGTIYENFVIDYAITRTWWGVDDNGNRGTECSQVIYVFRPLASAVMVDAPVRLECTANGLPDTDPALLGVPYVPYFVFDITGDGATADDTIAVDHICKMVAFHEDRDTIPSICPTGNEFKILREWTIVDWCESNDGDLDNGITNLGDQLIEIKDTSTPDFGANCPVDIDNDPLTTGTEINPEMLGTDSSNPNTCYTTIANLAAPTATGGCSDINYRIEIRDANTNVIAISGDSPLTNFQLDRGRWIVNFIAINSCNNNSTNCEVYLNVLDDDVPVAQCQDIDVSIADNPDGATKVYATSIENGSYDNCGVIKSMQVRRTGSGDAFADCVTVNCDDRDTEVMVDFRVCDDAGLINECTSILTVTDNFGFCPPVCSVEMDSLDLIFSLNENNATERTITPANINQGSTTTNIDFYISTDGNPLNAATSVLFNCSHLSTIGNPQTQTVYLHLFMAGTTTELAQCATEITLIDQTNPVLTCGDPLRINPNTTVTVSELFTSVTDNCTNSVTITGYSIDGGSTFMMSNTFTCPDMVDDTYSVIVQGVDGSGITGSCPTSIIVDCDGSGFGPDINGRILNEENVGIEHVQLELDNSDEESITTTETGEFRFKEVEVGQPYKLVPQKDIDPLNGVTTFDLVLITKHILGTEALENPYKMIAADVNNDGKITTTDVIELRKLILFIITDFPTNTSWRFVDANYEFSNIYNPWADTFPELYNIEMFEEDMEIDFVGIKVGDVNCSAIANNFDNSLERNKETVNCLSIEQQTLLAGETYTIDVKASQLKEIEGMQFTLGLDKEVVSFEGFDFENNVFSTFNIGTNFEEEGLFTASWVKPSESNLQNEAVLFKVKVLVKKDTKVSEVINISSRYTKSEAYLNGNTVEPVLEFAEPLPSTFYETEYDLYQNQPNPYSKTTSIGFYLPVSQDARLTIFDIAGKVILEIDGEYSIGYNEVVLDAAKLNTSGVLYYQLNTEGFSATRKMIVIE